MNICCSYYFYLQSICKKKDERNHSTYLKYLIVFNELTKISIKTKCHLIHMLWLCNLNVYDLSSNISSILSMFVLLHRVSYLFYFWIVTFHFVIYLDRNRMIEITQYIVADIIIVHITMKYLIVKLSLLIGDAIACNRMVCKYI